MNKDVKGRFTPKNDLQARIAELELQIKERDQIIENFYSDFKREIQNVCDANSLGIFDKHGKISFNYDNLIQNFQQKAPKLTELLLTITGQLKFNFLLVFSLFPNLSF